MCSHLKEVRQVTRKLVLQKQPLINSILREIADVTETRHREILQENQRDLDRMDPADPKFDRLKLTDERLKTIERDLRAVAALPSPLGLELESRTVSSGLQLRKISVPMGVVGVIYESRPNVTFDVFALCFKAGNAIVLKGSKDAHYSNVIIVKVIQEVLTKYGLENAVYLAPSDRTILPVILNATKFIDVIIPRGSEGLIRFVRENAKVPVIETGAGIVHTYYDSSADLTKGKAIIANAKTRRVSVCNALDTLLIHRDRLADLPVIFEGLDEKFGLTVYADPEAFDILADHYDLRLLHRAQPEHFGTEFLSMKMSVKVVNDLEEALDHIDQYSSKHSEAIIAENQYIIDQFMTAVDASTVYANASTAFTDGSEFGLGAEIGISTQKLHARGPMGLRELTSYKWLVTGKGHTRNS
ncbi:MAG: glutamate-5-semialdehyde dehydrogenase [Saprospiraceae bacterium]|nr:glutamate-5-semialdehyde dehydrogenase [Saprospiraceae bacterium]